MSLPTRSFRAPLLALLLPLAAGCAARARAGRGDADATVAPRRAASFPAEWRFRPGARAEFAPQAMIASNSRLASEAGVEILRRGGNAVDAAVAVGYALAVTYPVAGNIGGGGFMVIRLADGRDATIDYREVAPLAATRNMYLDAAGQPTDKSRVGHLAVGVPGAVMGMSEALAKFGTKPLAEVIAPAIRLAEGCAATAPTYRSSRARRSSCPAGSRCARARGWYRRTSRARCGASPSAGRASSTRARPPTCWWRRCGAAGG
jgi:gamma-glutamyltranspeptidase/glutathione hydrolase